MSKKVKLQDVAELTVGFVGNMTQEYLPKGVPFFRSLNIMPFEIDTSDLKFVSKQFNRKIKKSMLHTNDIVIVRTGNPGTCCVIPPEYDGSNCSDLVVVRPNSEKADSMYLATYIQYSAQKQIGNQKVGAIQKHFNIGSAKEMALTYFPDISVQRQIGQVINTINSKIALDKRINAELEAMAKTLYDYWFVQFDFPDENGKPYRTSGGAMEWNEQLKKDIPAGWTVKQVSSLTTVVTGKEDADFSTADGKYKFFTCSQDTFLCDSPAFDGHAVLIAGNGDFNVKHYTGKFNAYQRTYVLIPTEEKYYGCMYIASNDKVSAFKTGSNGSIVKFITKSDVEGITVFDVPQTALYCRINTIIGEIEHFCKENEELTRLRDWLLPMLMNGQATVSDEKNTSPTSNIVEIPKNDDERFSLWLQNQDIAMDNARA